jgi:tetratricopeptide (TPR) repeat protein
MAQQRYPEALRAQQLAIASSRTEIYRNRALRETANIYLAQRDMPDAMHVFETLTHGKAPTPWDFGNLGATYLLQGRCKEAAATFAEALKAQLFLMAHMGRIVSLMCIGDLNAMETEQTRLRPFLTKLGTAPASLTPQQSGRPEYQQITAALSYLQHHNWPSDKLTPVELESAVALAIYYFRMNHDSRFPIWLLRSLLDGGYADERLRSNLGYLYSNVTSQFLKDGHPDAAVEYLSRHIDCCAVDQRLEAPLRSLAQTDPGARSLLNAAKFDTFESSADQLP